MSLAAVLGLDALFLHDHTQHLDAALAVHFMPVAPVGQAH